MNKIINKWVFINYCGQKIGQFKGVDLHSPLLNVLAGQVSNLILIPIFYFYLLMGYRSFFILIILIILIVLLVRVFLKKYLMVRVSIKELESIYKRVTRSRRITYFLIAIILTGGSIIVFGYSLFFLKYI